MLTLPTGLAGRVFRKTSGELGLKRESVTLLGKTDGGPSTSISPPEGSPDFPDLQTKCRQRTLPAPSPSRGAALRTGGYFEKANHPTKSE